jgi:hypothetical protein
LFIGILLATSWIGFIIAQDGLFGAPDLQSLRIFVAIHKKGCAFSELSTKKEPHKGEKEPPRGGS